MWAVLTITGRIEVLGKETESQVEMETEESVRGVRGRARCEGAPSHSSRIKAKGNEPRKRLGRRLELPRDVVPFLVARSVGDNDIAPRDDPSRRTCGKFPKVLGFVVRRKQAGLGSEYCDPHYPPVLMVLERSLHQNYRTMGTQALVIQPS